MVIVGNGVSIGILSYATTRRSALGKSIITSRITVGGNNSVISISRADVIPPYVTGFHRWILRKHLTAKNVRKGKVIISSFNQTLLNMIQKSIVRFYQ